MDILRPSLKHLFLLTQIAGNVPSAVKKYLVLSQQTQLEMSAARF